jgi:hypothetical protein
LRLDPLSDVIAQQSWDSDLEIENPPQTIWLRRVTAHQPVDRVPMSHR